MNAATLSKSDRLKRVLRVLRDRRPHSTRDLIRRAHVCAINSIAAELRANGKRITCKRRGSRWYYQLTTAKG